MAELDSGKENGIVGRIPDCSGYGYNLSARPRALLIGLSQKWTGNRQ